MGVSAVFISTLALQNLPFPSNPPHSQQDFLALAIPSVVSFVVLSSIIIRASATKDVFSFLSLNSLSLSPPPPPTRTVVARWIINTLIQSRKSSCRDPDYSLWVPTSFQYWERGSYPAGLSYSIPQSLRRMMFVVVAFALLLNKVCLAHFSERFFPNMK